MRNIYNNFLPKFNKCVLIVNKWEFLYNRGIKIKCGNQLNLKKKTS